MDEARLIRLAPGLRLLEPGIWGTPRAQAVSYPSGGHAVNRDLEDDSFWFRHRNRCIVELARAHPPGGTLFDVGGGTGFVASGLRQAGFDVVLVEPGFEGARFGRERGLEPVVCATLDEAGFAPHSLPAAGAFDVIEHLPDDLGFLAALRQRLVSGGRLYLTVPAHAWLWSAEDRHAGHFRRYSLRGLSGVLAKAGYRVDFASYFFWPLPLPIWCARALADRLGLEGDPARKRYRRQHGAGSAGARLLERALRAEFGRLRRGRRVPCGSSLLAAATALPDGA
jgi:SAM-dependent methyltransferase